MADRVLQVEVISADRGVWEGEATSVVARTVEGDIGILPNHEPLLAALVPCAAEVLGTNGVRYVIAIDGGFISVENNRVSLLSQFGRLADEIDAGEAQHELTVAQRRLEEGDTSQENLHLLHRSRAQLKAAEKVGKA